MKMDKEKFSKFQGKRMNENYFATTQHQFTDIASVSSKLVNKNVKFTQQTLINAFATPKGPELSKAYLTIPSGNGLIYNPFYKKNKLNP
jgi:hypothetical protein